MADIIKQEVRLEDGRKADRLIHEVVDPSTGETKVVTEFYTEPKVKKSLSHRVTETKKPVCVRREIESIDEESGEIVERKVESTEPEVRMTLREHIQTESGIQAQSVKDDCDCYVTQEEMQKTFEHGLMTVLKALKTEGPVMMDQSSPKISMQSVLSERIEGATAAAKNLDLKGWTLWGSIAVLSALAVYVYFIM